MPRWNKLRTRPEYGHLYGTSLTAILEQAIVRRGYGGDRGAYPVEVNQALIGMFGARERLSMADLSTGADIIRGPRGWSAEFTLDYIGNLIGWGAHLGILEESPGKDGERGWRLVEREPVYEVVGGRAVRVRGLPPDEQFIMDRKMAAVRRLRLTLARKRAAQTRGRVAELLDAMEAVDPQAPIPEAWLPRLGDVARGMLVTEARGFILAAHDDWSPGDQQLWITDVKVALAGAQRAAAERRARDAEAAALASAIAEDEEAFEGL